MDDAPHLPTANPPAGNPPAANPPAANPPQQSSGDCPSAETAQAPVSPDWPPATADQAGTPQTLPVVQEEDDAGAGHKPATADEETEEDPTDKHEVSAEEGEIREEPSEEEDAAASSDDDHPIGDHLMDGVVDDASDSELGEEEEETTNQPTSPMGMGGIGNCPRKIEDLISRVMHRYPSMAQGKRKGSAGTSDTSHQGNVMGVDSSPAETHVRNTRGTNSDPATQVTGVPQLPGGEEQTLEPISMPWR